MEGKEYYLVAVLAFLLLMLLAVTVRNATFNDAIVNCIQANADWRVDVAHDYCNSVVRSGVRP
jgi:hypothetical protein